MHEPRRRFALFGRHFSAPAERGTRTAAGGFAPNGREVFRLKSSEELRSAERGDSPRPAAGQEGRHQGFYPLNSHFLLFVSLAQIRDRRPLRKRGTAEDFYYRRGAQCAPISLPLRSAGFRTATHTGYSTQARHIRVAQLAGLVATVGACGFDNWCNLSRRGATGRPAQRFTAA